MLEPAIAQQILGGTIIIINVCRYAKGNKDLYKWEHIERIELVCKLSFVNFSLVK